MNIYIYIHWGHSVDCFWGVIKVRKCCCFLLAHHLGSELDHGNHGKIMRPTIIYIYIYIYILYKAVARQPLRSQRATCQATDVALADLQTMAGESLLGGASRVGDRGLFCFANTDYFYYYF